MSEHRHETHPAIVKRLNRAGGHLRSIVEMIENERPCAEIERQEDVDQRSYLSLPDA